MMHAGVTTDVDRRYILFCRWLALTLLRAGAEHWGQLTLQDNKALVRYFISALYL
jgi:hypothetical protein